MKKFTLSISLENVAFSSMAGVEIARILNKLANMLNDYTLEQKLSGNLRDYNGNTVGKWKVS